MHESMKARTNERMNEWTDELLHKVAKLLKMHQKEKNDASVNEAMIEQT